MSQFVIVIEADNVRARKAYQKGLDDLDRVLPQLLVVAQRQDDEARRKREEKQAKELQEQQKEMDEMREWFKASAALAKWEASSCWTRGDRPVVPPEPWHYPRIRYYEYPLPEHKQSLLSIRSQLKHMLDVAAAAIGPYRMTEHQVARMVEWEDGSEIERLQLAYKDEP